MKIGPMSFGFTWVGDGTGYSSRTSAVLASWQNPRKVTWAWALYWQKPKRWLDWPRVSRWSSPGGEMGSYSVRFPVGGLLTLSTQDYDV